MFRLVKFVVATAAVLASVSVSAATYTFILSGADYNGSGTIIAADANGEANQYPCATCVSGLGYAVTGISGVINGAAITGVAPLGTIAGNNNKIYGQAPYLDWGDLGFTTADHAFNVFNADYAGHPGDYLAVDSDNIYFHPVTFSITAAPVPEPGIWAMMAAGLTLVGGAARRRSAAKAS